MIHVGENPSSRTEGTTRTRCCCWKEEVAIFHSAIAGRTYLVVLGQTDQNQKAKDHAWTSLIPSTSLVDQRAWSRKHVSDALSSFSLSRFRWDRSRRYLFSWTHSTCHNFYSLASTENHRFVLSFIEFSERRKHHRRTVHGDFTHSFWHRFCRTNRFAVPPQPV